MHLQKTTQLEKNEKEQGPSKITLLNLCVNIKKDCLGCYSCGEQISIIPSSSKTLIQLDSFEFLLNKLDKDFSISQFLKTYGHCKCGAKILLDARLPLGYFNNLETDYVNSIKKEHIKQMEEKEKFVKSYGRVLSLHAGMNPLEVQTMVPNQWTFTIQPIKEKELLIHSFEKFNLISTNLEQSMFSNFKLLEDQKENPKLGYSGGLPIADSTCVNFWDIDRSYYDFPYYLFLDIDGTSTVKTIDVSNKLSTILFKFLTLLEKKKILKTVLVSGRPIEWLYMKQKDEGLKPLVIGDNGCSAAYMRVPYDRTDSIIHYQVTNIKEDLRHVLGVIFNKYKIGPSDFYEFRKGYKSGSEVMIFDTFFKPVENLRKIIKQDEEVKEICKLRGLGNLNVVDAGNGMLHITSENFTKGTAIKKLLEKLHIEKENTMSVGNCFNDISVVENVGYSCSVGNGEKEYKEKVKYVSPKNEAAGTLDSIKSFLSAKEAWTPELVKELEEELEKEFALEKEFLLGS